MDAFMGMIMPFAGNFAPPGWMMCNGQTLNISQYSALYAILGTSYGGDGRSTFALPNLNGRALVGAGQLSGGSNYVVGQTGGAEKVTLNTNQLPTHNHTLNGVGAPGTAPGVGGNMLAGSGTAHIYAPASTGAATPMDNSSISSVGAGQPVPTTTPYQCITYIICVSGIFPPRS